MNSLDTEFRRRLVAHTTERSKEVAGQVLTGAMDHEEYKRQCGYLKALGDVAEWCDEIEKTMSDGK